MRTCLPQGVDAAKLPPLSPGASPSLRSDLSGSPPNALPGDAEVPTAVVVPAPSGELLAAPAAGGLVVTGGPVPRPGAFDDSPMPDAPVAAAGEHVSGGGADAGGGGGGGDGGQGAAGAVAAAAPSDVPPPRTSPLPFPVPLRAHCRSRCVEGLWVRVLEGICIRGYPGCRVRGLGGSAGVLPVRFPARGDRDVAAPVGPSRVRRQALWS